ncbi:zinc-binding alcohol dehydrogenase family protein [Aspergillus aculeatinus CBS 121060]|uniref:Alcohol dehydrogenase n=1 Tax=Aspergillus aculeatinus CBS 121060 TaxID=1448322 RepID=A0ACD1HD25_9EURO|nr:putative alcohol dehydrogenase [Aspergillus aculeatinus CBS 121060]RAH71555.1 putative alcohol dehydrogenase [Aspergillus aculeatinus CBS 121060]
MTTHHLAAISPGPGQPLELRTRPTPKPGPNDLLIAVKSIALNPADHIMQDTGLFIPDTSYPTVQGFDLAGLVLEVGDAVPQNAPFHPGTRIAAYSALVWKACSPDYGAFQERCLVPWQHAVILPNEDGHELTWNEAATLPVSVQVALSAWDAMGIPRPPAAAAAAAAALPSNPDQIGKSQALLVWGASSSVGSMGVQTARLLCDSPTTPFAAVYATAGTPRSRAYVASLGADRVFDYYDPLTPREIVDTARRDGLTIRHCFLAMGQLAACRAVVGAFRGEDQVTGKIASAPPVPPDAGVVDDGPGVETVFVMPAAGEKQRLAQFREWLGSWLKESLEGGRIRPSPEGRVVGKGLGAVNAGLDELRRGVSCVKLVIEVSE